MKRFLLLLCVVCWLPLWAEDETEPVDYGMMFNWETHSSYMKITELVKTHNDIFCLADGAVFSMNIKTKELTLWNKPSGLNGGKVNHLYYVPDLDAVLLVYVDNMLDLIDQQGNITPIRDLYQTTSKAISLRCAYVHKNIIYFGTDFGIIAVNLKNREVEDTYYIGEHAKDVMITQIAIANDTLYAISDKQLYYAPLQSNLINYSVWKSELLADGTWTEFVSYNDQLVAIYKEKIMIRNAGVWKTFSSSEKWLHLKTHAGKLFALNTKSILYNVQEDGTSQRLFQDYAQDVVYDVSNHVYWIGSTYSGLCEVNEQNLEFINTYHPDGPLNNNIYSLTYAGEKLFICPGYRWADRGYVECSFSFRNPDGSWGGVSNLSTNKLSELSILDLVAIGIDPNDDGHFFMSSYGMGVVEYRNNQAYKQYTEGTPGCAFKSLVAGNPRYVRTEGATVDQQGNLWVLQPGGNVITVHIFNMETEQWTAYNLFSGGKQVIINTPKGIWIDKRNSQHKWMLAQRAGACIVLLDDGGTPANPNDDRCKARSTLTDQNNNTISFTYIYDWAQDRNNDIWVGLEGGLVIIPSTVDFMNSDQCKRVIIPRNDGTGLADYLLANDNVRAIAVDGGNRKWLGTETSGIYLVSEDGLSTIYHFTEENSPLPSNYITDIAIHPTTGEVFIGTNAGLVCFRSDASEPFEEYNQVVAYPNPVRPNYDGVITISGLTEGTVINIIDQGGQLVCKTNANGGTAIWDLKNGDGKRVSSGIYTALCNDAAGNHQIVKIMVMNR